MLGSVTRVAGGELPVHLQQVDGQLLQTNAPVSSAIGMNSAGPIMPRVGWFQRSSASGSHVRERLALIPSLLQAFRSGWRFAGRLTTSPLMQFKPGTAYPVEGIAATAARPCSSFDSR